MFLCFYYYYAAFFGNKDDESQARFLSSALGNAAITRIRVLLLYYFSLLYSIGNDMVAQYTG